MSLCSMQFLEHSCPDLLLIVSKISVLACAIYDHYKHLILKFNKSPSFSLYEQMCDLQKIIKLVSCLDTYNI